METSKYLTRHAFHRKYHKELVSEKDFKWAVKLNQYSLKLIGVWPKSEQTAWEKRLCNLRALLIFSTILLVLVIPGIHSLIRIHFDILLVTDNLQYNLPIITCLLRLVIFWWKKEAVTSIINMIADDWIKVKTAQEKAVMIRRAQIARIIITFGYSLMGIGWIVIVMFPIFGHSMRYLTNYTDLERPLPIQTYYIYDTINTPQYELTFTIQSIAIFFCIMCYTGIDNFLSLSIFHISGQLDILRNRLLCLHNVANYNDVLKSCVMEHIRLFRYSTYVLHIFLYLLHIRAIDHAEDIFNIILLILFVYFGILFTFYGFWFINMLDSGLTIFHTAYILSVFVNMFGHMCMYCAVGEMLTAQCDGIYYAVYFNKWYTLNRRTIRDLVLIMIKTHKPFYLNIGKVFPLTMATFCNLLKTSAGYISVLLTTRNQSKV